IALSLVIFLLYYRTLAPNGRTPSLLFFALIRPIFFFAFINWFFSMTAWSALFAGLLLDWLVRNSLVGLDGTYESEPDHRDESAHSLDRLSDGPEPGRQKWVLPLGVDRLNHGPVS